MTTTNHFANNMAKIAVGAKVANYNTGSRTREYQASQRDARKARYQPWCQDAIFGARPASPRHLLAARDLKRLAAHDLDD